MSTIKYKTVEVYFVVDKSMNVVACGLHLYSEDILSLNKYIDEGLYRLIKQEVEIEIED